MRSIDSIGAPSNGNRNQPIENAISKSFHSRNSNATPRAKSVLMQRGHKIERSEHKEQHTYSPRINKRSE